MRGSAVRVRAAVLAAVAAVAAASLPAAAQLSCDALKGQIDARVRASGITRFTLTVVDAAASAPGKVVGSCERGARKIVYLASDGKPPPASVTGPASSAAAAAASASGHVKSPDDEPIITECRDGSISMVGICPK